MVHRALGIRQEHIATAVVEELRAAGGTCGISRRRRAARGVSRHRVHPGGAGRALRRTGYLASRLEAHGVTVVASFVSPYRESRDFVRKLCREFVEIYVATPWTSASGVTSRDCTPAPGVVRSRTLPGSTTRMSRRSTRS